MRTPAVLALALVASLVQAQPQPKPLQIPIQQHKLDNGLRIVLSEDHSAPTYSISITYNVGSHNERQGPTIFPHLFEDIRFQGAQHDGKDEHIILFEKNDGEANGTPTLD